MVDGPQRPDLHFTVTSTDSSDGRRCFPFPQSVCLWDVRAAFREPYTPLWSEKRLRSDLKIIGWIQLVLSCCHGYACVLASSPSVQKDVNSSFRQKTAEGSIRFCGGLTYSDLFIYLLYLSWFSYFVMSCCITSCYFISCHVPSYFFLSCPVILNRIVSHYYIQWRHVVLY